MKKIVGGGPNKVLYTLSTVKRIGLKQSAKALNSKNTCKACGLGMGGQRGGMTNEMDEFPSVCNKSIQAQSTDIQPPIPLEIFSHTVDELKALSAHQLEHLGRLNTPLLKEAGAKNYTPITWDVALSVAAQHFKASDPDKAFFYSSGRSSNESGYLLQMLARIYGTNNVNNCSYYCHQATGVGLNTTIGTGTATVELDDLSGCDCIFVIGANPASNHPRFIHQLKKCRDRGGKVVVINPAKEPGLVKFAVPKSFKSMIAGGTDIASHYVQPVIGGDIALFKGIAKALLGRASIDRAFISRYTKGFNAFEDDINATLWEEIVASSGVPREHIEQIARVYGESSNVVFAWGMGMTHHQFGTNNVEYIANLALLRGMVAKRYAGLLPLRGHSNVQGVGSVGVKPVLVEDVLEAMETNLGVSLPVSKGLDTYSALKSAYEKKIDNALIVGGNVYSATPDSLWASKALNRIGFKCFLTTTLNQGHLHGSEHSATLILPVLARDEERQPTTQESMFNYVRLSDGGIDRLDNLKSETEILVALGKRIIDKNTFDFTPFANHQTVRESIAAVVPGMEALADIAKAKEEFYVKNRLRHKPVFRTASNKAHFVVHPIPRSTTNERFPFLLASVRSEGQFNSIIYEEKDSYRYQAPRHAVLMCNDDMSRLGLNEGDLVTVSSSVSSLKDRVVVMFELPKGSVLAYYPEANCLAEGKLDPRSKTPNFKSIPVAIVKQASN